MKRVAVLAVALLVVGCGGGSPEPLVEASVSGEVNGQPFTPTHGVSAAFASGTVATVIGTGEIGCDNVSSNDLPPSGIYVNIQIPEAVLGLADEQFFSYSVIDGGDLEGGGSGAGTVEVTALDEATITMTVSHTDQVGNDSYAVDGSFTAIRCSETIAND